jgi:hypothetical protein
MRSLIRGALFTAALVLLPNVATAAEPTTTATVVRAESPTFPTPYIAAIVGLSLTAVAVVATRVTERTSNTMMYSVLACVALTAVFVSAAHRIHSNFDNELQHLRQTAAR